MKGLKVCADNDDLSILKKKGGGSMKSFNFFIIVFLFVILGGFIYFKDGFTKTEVKADTTENSRNQILYDRIQYLDYSNQNFINSQKNGRTLLFFAATTWCSNCVELEKQIQAHLSDLPKDITILKVDYDRDTKTKNEYGVTMQTTLVLLNENGKEIKRWIGTGSFTDLMQNIN